MDISINTPNTEGDVIDAYNFADGVLIFTKSYPRSQQFYINVFQKDPRYILIAKENKEIVGVALSSDKDENTLLIGEVAVAEKVRGMGIGSMLISKIEQNAKLLNKDQIFLAAKDNKAENFYLKNGYMPKLFIQIPGNNRLDEIKKHILGKIEWENTGDGFSKVVIDTLGVNKEFQKNINDQLNAHTQYLFLKSLTK